MHLSNRASALFQTRDVSLRTEGTLRWSFQARPAAPAFRTSSADRLMAIKTASPAETMWK
jgi:hypothetical protein